MSSARWRRSFVSISARCYNRSMLLQRDALCTKSSLQFRTPSHRLALKHLQSSLPLPSLQFSRIILSLSRSWPIRLRLTRKSRCCENKPYKALHIWLKWVVSMIRSFSKFASISGTSSLKMWWQSRDSISKHSRPLIRFQVWIYRFPSSKIRLHRWCTLMFIPKS